jgi:F-type H+-transporting ATPase subunit a
MASGHFTLFDLAHVPYDYTYVAANVAATGLIVAFSLAARVSLGNGEAAVTPASKFSVKGMSEVLVEFIDNLTREVIGPQARKYVPLFGAVFFFIAFSNLFGLVPGMTAATSNINAALAIGIFSFLTYNIIGLKHGGWHYLAHFFGPVWWLAWLMLPLELISHSVRPFSLGMRLSINMTADHTILGTFLDLTKVGVPVIFYGMGTFVSLVQAFVFTMLSMVYVSLATEDEH